MKLRLRGSPHKLPRPNLPNRRSLLTLELTLYEPTVYACLYNLVIAFSATSKFTGLARIPYEWRQNNSTELNFPLTLSRVSKSHSFSKKKIPVCRWNFTARWSEDRVFVAKDYRVSKDFSCVHRKMKYQNSKISNSKKWVLAMKTRFSNQCALLWKPLVSQEIPVPSIWYPIKFQPVQIKKAITREPGIKTRGGEKNSRRTRAGRNQRRGSINHRRKKASESGKLFARAFYQRKNGTEAKCNDDAH